MCNDDDSPESDGWHRVRDTMTPEDVVEDVRRAWRNYAVAFGKAIVPILNRVRAAIIDFSSKTI